MTAVNKIDYIETPTRDIKATKAFFESLFGWEFKDYGPDYIAYNDGRLAGGFYVSDQAASVAKGSALIVFYTDSLEEYQKKAQDLGGKVIKPIYSFPGGRRFHFTDPGGSEFAIWSE
jgi:hypothetical protein